MHSNPIRIYAKNELNETHREKKKRKLMRDKKI